MKVKKSTLMQYVLIYIMLIIPGSCLFAKVLTGNIKYICVLGLFAFLFFTRKKYQKPYAILFSGIVLVIVFFQRMLTGGVGISAWMQFAVCLLSTQFAIACNKEAFLDRWIRVVVFFSVVSVIFWLLFCAFPNLVNLWPAQTYFTQAIGSRGWEVNWHGKGVLLYSYLEIHPTRNCGIYTEPGVYQVVLNSALYILFFWKEKLQFTGFKQYRTFVAVIIITLISCQSTTGYIGLILNLVFFFVLRQKENRMIVKIKRYVLLAVIIGIIAILIEYSFNGTNSILYQQIIVKLFGTSNTGIINLTEGSGRYRIGTILFSLNVISRNPFGVGYDTFALLKNDFGQGLVAASIASFAAIYGIIPWGIMMILIFKPVFSREKRALAWLFVLLFVNTTLAQTDLLYPALLMIPTYLMLNRAPLDKSLELKKGMV